MSYDKSKDELIEKVAETDSDNKKFKLCADLYSYDGSHPKIALYRKVFGPSGEVTTKFGRVSKAEILKFAKAVVEHCEATM